MPGAARRLLAACDRGTATVKRGFRSLLKQSRKWGLEAPGARREREAVEVAAEKEWRGKAEEFERDVQCHNACRRMWYKCMRPGDWDLIDKASPAVRGYWREFFRERKERRRSRPPKPQRTTLPAVEEED